MSKRVLMIAFTFYRSDTRVRRLAEALAERGDLVDVLCLAEDDLPQKIGGVRLFGLTRRRLNRGMAGQLMEYVRFTLVAMLKALCLTCRKRYSVIHVHTMPDFLVAASWIPRLFGARVILDIHDTFPELFAARANVPETHWLVRSLIWVEKVSAWTAHRVIAVHEPHRQQLIQHGIPKEKIDVVLNLPDESVFIPWKRNSKKDDTTTVIYHGSISKHLALDVMVDAAKSITRANSSVRFVMMGGGNAADELFERVRRDGLDSVFRVVPHFRPVEQIISEISKADIGVIPCRLNRATDLMLPTKLLEYVRLGIPCVAPRITAIEHYFDDDMVRFWDPSHPKSFAGAILDLVHNPSLRRSIARNALDFNDRYSWATHKHDYFAVIDGDIIQNEDLIQGDTRRNPVSVR